MSAEESAACGYLIEVVLGISQYCVLPAGHSGEHTAVMPCERVLRVGDSVTVDITGLSLALCPSCETVGLAVPDGACVSCGAPADTLVFDPEPLRVDGSEPNEWR